MQENKERKEFLEYLTRTRNEFLKVLRVQIEKVRNHKQEDGPAILLPNSKQWYEGARFYRDEW